MFSVWNIDSTWKYLFVAVIVNKRENNNNTL